MPPKRRRLPHTFPHKIVFLISLVLCLCACGSIVNGVLAWSNRLWGYYWGTGFWSGGVILLAGMFGIVASYVRNICSVKTFMIISIFGCLVSLGMVALAAGGLDSDSGFYGGFNRTTFMTHVIHAVYLGLGVLQLTLCVLSDGICINYLFIERSAELYRVKNSDVKKHKKKPTSLGREGKNRSSTGSEVPLVDGESTSKPSKRKQKHKKDKKHKHRRSEPINDEDVDLQDDLPIPYTATGSLDRPALRRQENSVSKTSPVRSTCTRSASFSTFGRTGGPDRVSLIVHPTDDNASVADTIASRTQTPDQRSDTECHYAQTLLFGPPLPIEEDDELPPYEAVDSRLYRNMPRRGLKRPKSEEMPISSSQARRTNSAPVRAKRKSDKINRNSQTRSQIPPGRKENTYENDTQKKRISDLSNNAVGQNVALRLSRSADLLSFEDETKNRKSSHSNSNMHEQGVACRDFAHSSDMILVMDQEVQLRHRRPQSQSLKVNRERRLDRRRRALSAEVKLNKDQLLAHERMVNNETGLERRTNSFDGSNSSLFASNRIMPTKFSLRTPVRQIGMPHVCSPVPVKPLVALPLVTPPAKPPRSYSVTVDDLKDMDTDIDGEVENVFADINELNKNDDDVFTLKQSSVSTDMKAEQSRGDMEQKPNKVNIEQVPQNYNKKISPSETSVTANESDKNAKNIEPRNVTLDTNRTSAPLSPEIKLDSGPVLKFVPPKRESEPPIDYVDGFNRNDKVKNDFVTIEKSKNAGVSPEKAPADTMVLPTSPIMRPPPITLVFVNKIDPKAKVTDTETKQLGDINEKNAQPNETVAKTNQKESKLNQTEVVYAKVMKETTTSPVSPISPSAKVQKAKRLTYSFKDKDLSVFDPIGNSKENEQTIEVAETVSVQHPVQSPKETKPVKRHNDKSYSEKTGTSSDSLSNLRVRLPPVSPSERILQRKAIKTESQKDVLRAKEERPVIIQPTNVLKDFNKSSNGARPKTTYRGLFAPLTPPKSTISERPVKIQPYGSNEHKADTKPKETGKLVSNAIPSSDSNASSGTPQRNFVQSLPSTPQTSSPLASSKSAKPPPPAKAPLTHVNDSSKDEINRVPNDSVQLLPVSNPPTAVLTTTYAAAARDVPVNRVQAIPMPAPRSTNSQGVLHLPQSQYSRHVSGNTQHPGVSGNNAQAVGPPPNVNFVQQNNNNLQQNNDNQQNKPLFSVLL